MPWPPFQSPAALPCPPKKRRQRSGCAWWWPTPAAAAPSRTRPAFLSLIFPPSGGAPGWGWPLSSPLSWNTRGIFTWKTTNLKELNSSLTCLYAGSPMPGTILVVDDEPQILQTVAGILADEGFEVLTAPDGESALQLVAAGPPDLVLLDIALPGRAGLEALQELKRQYAALPVVMISAYGSVENEVKATRLGAYDYIEKPPHAEKILLTVRNALEMARLSEENRGV